MGANSDYLGNSRWQTIPASAASTPSLFTIVFVSGLIIFILLLIGRQAINWYIKHNAMLDQLTNVKTQAQRTNAVLRSIQRQLKQWRKQMQQPNTQLTRNTSRRYQKDEQNIMKSTISIFKEQ